MSDNLPTPARGYLSPKKKSKQPFSAEEFKLKLLKDAGVGDERLIALVKKVVDSAEAELEATKQTPITEHGRVLDVFEQPDYSARAKARDQIIEIVGLKKGGHTEGSGGPAVVINAPQWVQAKPQVEVSKPLYVVVDSTDTTSDYEALDVEVEPSHGESETPLPATSEGKPQND